MKLFWNALLKFSLGFAILGALLFVPAGTLGFSRGWLLLGVLFLPMLLMGAVMLAAAPDLLRRRLDGKEKTGGQKGIVGLSALMFLGGFILSGLDYRFGWSRVPFAVSVAAAVIFLIGYGLYGEVLRENAYLSRTVKVEEGQTLVDSGLYAVVRHPMYLATLLMFLPIPLILGSLAALPLFLVYPVLIVCRIRGEETLLSRELVGYEAYMKKVKYRLLPFIW